MEGLKELKRRKTGEKTNISPENMRVFKGVNGYAVIYDCITGEYVDINGGHGIDNFYIKQGEKNDRIWIKTNI